MLGILQAGVLLSRLVLVFTANKENRFRSTMRGIKSNRPALAILGSITAVTLISIISAILSILPHQSWWGRVPAGFEAGEFTALMYVILSVSAFISIQEHNNRDALWRTFAITGFLAALIGFFQFLGWSPLDISSTHNSKLTGTNGNPIFFGAMLVLLSPVTLGVMIDGYRQSSKSNQRLWMIAIAATSYLLALSLVTTASRGPWLGMLAAGVVAIILLISVKQLQRNVLAIGLIAGFAMLGALTATFVDPTPPDPIEEPGAVIDAANSPVTPTLSGVTRSNTLNLRIRYWKLSGNMSRYRDPVPHTSDAPMAVRFLFGYGPDMFRFAATYFSDNTTFTRRLTAAHNDPINRLVEQGILGFLAWMSLWASIAYGSITLIRRTRAANPNVTHWMPILLTAALAGRFVEQLFGSPTTGGVFVFWVLIGILAGLLMATRQSPTQKSVPSQSSATTKITTYASVAIIALASIVLAWDRGANYLIANQMASFQYRPDVLTAEQAIDRLERATELAPDVSRYWHDLAEIEHGRAASTENQLAKADALSKAYEYDLRGHQANPLEVNSIYKTAFSAWESGNRGRPELRQEAVRLYELLREIIPSDELAKERLDILNEYLSEQPE